jgi:hypothetical protein
VRRLLGELAAYCVLAAVLTAIVAAFYELRTVDVLARVFAFNLLVALCIGVLIDLAQRVVDARFALERRTLLVRLAVHGIIIGSRVSSSRSRSARS